MLSAEEKGLAKECLRTALEAGAQKARVSLSKSNMNLVSTLNAEVDKISSCMDRSMEISIFADGRFGSFSTNKLETGSLRSFIGNAVQTVRMLAPDPCRDLPDRDRQVKGPLTGRELGLFDDSCAELTAERRREYALQAAVKTKSGDGWKLVSEEGEYSDTQEFSYIADTGGLEAEHHETCISYGVETTIKNSRGRKYSSYWWDSTPLLRDFDPEGIGRKALQLAVERLGSRRVKGGKYNMVLDAEFAYKVVSPVLRALNGYSIQQGNSFLAGSAGKQVFPQGMTLLDCPHIKGQTGSRLFDSEGVATHGHAIIENGVVREYFLNTYMANKLGMEPTQEDAIRPVLLRYPSDGSSPSVPEGFAQDAVACRHPSAFGRTELMRLCGDGILVTGFNGGNSNSATGNFSYGIEGFLFKDGNIVRPVNGMLVTGNFLSLWAGFIASGDDARPCQDKLIPSLAFRDVDFSG